MSVSDIVAIIGAAAWAPQIVEWINDARKKPRLELIPAPTIVLGYTGYGPVVRLAVSLSSQHEDVIITNMTMLVQHESREERLLRWSSVTERLASFNVPEIEGLSMNRTQHVLAIKAITETLTEKYLTFNDLDFGRRAQEKINAAREHFINLTDQGKLGRRELIHSKEFKEALQLLKDNVFWREGKYIVELRVCGKQLKHEHVDRFATNLTRTEIEGLNANMHYLEEGLEEYVTTGKPAHKPWAFAHSSLTHLNS